MSEIDLLDELSHAATVDLPCNHKDGGFAPTAGAARIYTLNCPRHAAMWLITRKKRDLLTARPEQPL